MNLSEVLLFLGGIVAYRFIFDQKAKIWVILIASVFGLFWLQSALLIRNLDFWFPFISISLIIVSWLVITPKEKIINKENIFAFLLVIITILLITFSRYLPFDFRITPTIPPQTISVLLAIMGLFIIFSIIHFFINNDKNFPSYLILFFILLLFIVLKTPMLNSKISIFLRMVTSQPLIQSQGSDLRWVGFSYIAFRLIHTLRDYQNNRYKSTNLCSYISFVLYFPAFIAGPIDKIEHFEQEIEKKTDKQNDFQVGGKRLIIGLFKKFVIADTLVLIAINSSNALLVKSSIWLWIMLIAYAWMIYYDFSGYTDIALGLSACIGISLPENFDHPYSAQNLTIFWNKWHMSLTQWFRSYFFNPITRYLRSGNKPLLPVLIIALTQISTMTLIGLWHGISWNFVFWGLWHGIGLFIHNRWAFFMQKNQNLNRFSDFTTKLLPKVSVITTFFFVAIGWIWFAIPDPQMALTILKKLFGII